MCLNYARKLPAAVVLPTVRRWLSNAGTEVDAVYLMGHLAEPADMPELVERLPGAWERRDFYGLASLIDAVARHPVELAISLLRGVWSDGEYSYLRTRLAPVDARRRDVRSGTDSVRDIRLRGGGPVRVDGVGEAVKRLHGPGAHRPLVSCPVVSSIIC